MTARVIIAVDSFKGSIDAASAAEAIKGGWLRVRPHDDVRRMPMADGGEGTLEAFRVAVPGAQVMPVTVTGPDDRRIQASWLLLPPPTDAPPGTAGVGVMELASTSGIELIGASLRPLDAHTVGFGEAIRAALQHGVSRLVLGIGSSSSTDGGMGLLSALGARFVDADGAECAPGGGALTSVASVDLSGLPPLPGGGVTVLTDVTNPLLGKTGAATVFGPQKGASADDVLALEAGLSHLSELMEVSPDVPGAGAAGGAGFGLLAWGAELVRGSAAVAELIGLREELAGARLAITGEGSYDGQSAAGKVPSEVCALAASHNVPVALVAGRIAAATNEFAAALSLTDLAGSGDAAISDPARWLDAAGESLARTVPPLSE